MPLRVTVNRVGPVSPGDIQNWTIAPSPKVAGGSWIVVTTVASVLTRSPLAGQSLLPNLCCLRVVVVQGNQSLWARPQGHITPGRGL